jgi:Arc/MetJ-type ribon-helix-helix transcriptional regulator
MGNAMPQNHVTVKIPKELVDEMDKLKGKHGFRSRGEIAKEALRQFLAKYESDLAEPSRFEQVNAGEHGVLLLDRLLKKTVDVYIKPSGISCSVHKTDDCEHVKFALGIPEVVGIIKRKRREGWKLPEV